MTDREERQHVIEVLNSWDGYFIGYSSDEVQEALRYAINSIEVDLKYDLLYEETSGQADKTTPKDDLGVDAISRVKVIDYLCKHCPDDGECFEDCDEIKHLRQMSSVTPQEPILNKIREQIKSHLRGVEITLEVLVENDPLRPKMEGAKDTLEECLEIIDRAESEA